MRPKQPVHRLGAALGPQCPAQRLCLQSRVSGQDRQAGYRDLATVRLVAQSRTDSASFTAPAGVLQDLLVVRASSSRRTRHVGKPLGDYEQDRRLSAPVQTKGTGS